MKKVTRSSLIMLALLAILSGGCSESSPPTASSPTVPTNPPISTNPVSEVYTFDFDTVSPGSSAILTGTSTPFEYKNGGLTARFSSPSDPIAFSVQTGSGTSLTLSRFSGKYLYQNNTQPSSLKIGFSQPLTDISLTFATSDLHDVGEAENPTSVRLTAYLDSTETNIVGSVSARGTFSTDSFPQGTLSFSSTSQTFSWVKLELQFQPRGGSKFLLDNIVASVTDSNVDNQITANKVVTDSVVIIKYAPTFVLQDSNNILVVNVSIENRGYDTFNTSPEYFYVKVGNTKYPCDTTLSTLRTFDIPDGGKITGKLAFQLPSEARGENGYNLVYSGTQMYNVQWFNVPR